MAGFVEGIDRGQSTLFPAVLDDYVAEDNGDTAIWLMSVNSSGGAQVMSSVDYGIIPTSWQSWVVQGAGTD
jgi:hypothetical protein